MDLFQLFLGIYFALLGSYLSILMSRILKQNGRVLDKIDLTTRVVGEKMDEGFRRMDEGFRKMDERAEERHREVIELIKALAGR
jgi:hypothetical protein